MTIEAIKESGILLMVFLRNAGIIRIKQDCYCNDESGVSR